MAFSKNATPMSRRSLVAGVAALSAATGISTVTAAAQGLQVAGSDGGFVEKCRLSQAAKAAMEAHFARDNPVIDAMIEEIPELPATLLEPLDITGSGDWTEGPAKGWSVDQLSEMVRGFRNIMERSDTPEGMVIREKNLPVPSHTRDRAAALLEIRKTFDLQHKAVWDEIHRLEDTAAEPVKRAYAAAFTVLEHPVFTVAEIVQKIDIADRMELYFSSGDKEDDARDAIFNDIRAIVSQEQHNV